MAKGKRGRRSKVQMLPDKIKEQLDEMLRDGKLTQKDILGFINGKLADEGIDKLSRSGFNRYSTRMESAGSRIREAREVAEAWTAKLGSKPTGEVSSMMIEMIRTLAFDLTMSAADGPEQVSPKFLNELALTMQRLETAAEKSTKQIAERRKAFAEEAVNAVEKVSKEAGISQETYDDIKREILGIGNGN